MPLALPTPQRGAAITPIAFVRALVAGYDKYGVPSANLLERAGITPADLQSPSARITGRQMELVSEVAMRELDDEALGWFSTRLRWGSYGMLLRASLSAPRIGLALARFFRHHRLLIDDLVLKLEVKGGRATVSLIENQGAPIAAAMRSFCLLSYLRLIHGYACWMVDSHIHLQRVTLPFAQPEDATVYPILFSRVVEFGARVASFSFDAALLDLPQVRDDDALRQMLRRPLILSLRPYRRDRLIINRVRKLLKDDPRRFDSALAVAEHLSISVRTLHRHFAEHDASFYQLKDEVRRDLALDLLHGTNKSIKQIALSLGFANEKSFYRTFLKWTGDPPGKIRQRELL